MKGKLLIFSGPSGSGKTTIVHHLLKSVPGLTFSISATTRPMRKNEVNGVDYFFLSTGEFRKKIKNNEFLEWEEVYEHQFYGTLISEVEKITSTGKHVIFDVDVEGGVNIKKTAGKNALAVFIKPPSIQVLEERLRLRSTEDEHSFRKRMSKAVKELTYTEKFDAVIVNSNLNEAFTEAETLVRNFLNRGK